MDLNSGTFIAQITGLPVLVNAKGASSGANGLAIAANVGKAYVSDQVDNAVHVYSMSSNRQTDVIPTTQKGSDSVVYDAVDKKVYVTNGGSKSLTVIDAVSDTVLKQIFLPGGPELAVWDPFDDTILQNLSATNQQAVIDAKTDTIEVVFNLPPGCGPHGADVDPTNQHIVIGCGGPMMVIMDGGNGRILSLTTDVGGADTVAFNPADHRFYTASSGNKPNPALGVLDAGTGNWLSNVTVEASAHSIAVDPTTGRVYLVAQTSGHILVFGAGVSVTQLP